MKRFTIFTLIFSASLMVCAGLAWLAGYNFDERGFGVMASAVCALGVSMSVAALFTLS